jgi:hypothetical protein
LDSASSRRTDASSSIDKVEPLSPSNLCRAFRICRSFSVISPYNSTIRSLSPTQ